MPFRRRGEDEGKAEYFVASEDASRIASEIGPLVESAVGVDWYGHLGNDADVAALALCRLRRARAAVGGGIAHGDAAVREALDSLTPAALAWLTSRAISYMDENGFPEAVEPYIEAGGEQ